MAKSNALWLTVAIAEATEQALRGPPVLARAGALRRGEPAVSDHLGDVASAVEAIALRHA